MKKDIFDQIAKYYGLFYQYQKKKYGRLLDLIYNDLDLFLFRDIVDVGCGTGALCSELSKRGFRVTGVDASLKMLGVATKKLNTENVKLVQGNVLIGLPFENKSFDVSVASFVAHGLQPEERKRLYLEMLRITKHVIIFYDYNKKRSALTSIMETLEGGDYFNFIKKAEKEMKECFGNVSIIDMGDQASCYVVRIPEDALA